MAYTDNEAPEDEGCAPCARLRGLLLLTIGGALVWMGTDLITGGALTRAVFGAPAVPGAPLPGNDDEDEDEVSAGAEGDADAA